MRDGCEHKPQYYLFSKRLCSLSDHLLIPLIAVILTEAVTAAVYHQHRLHCCSTMALLSHLQLESLTEKAVGFVSIRHKMKCPFLRINPTCRLLHSPDCGMFFSVKTMSFNQMKRQEAQSRMMAARKARRSPQAAAKLQHRASLVGDGAKWRITNLNQVARAIARWA
jgi:hypothetical protein